MKTIRIFSLPSHQEKDRTHGVDLARVIQPMKHLNGYKDKDVTFKVDIFDINAKIQPDWLNVSKQYDIIYLNYINNPWAFAAMGAMARKNGVKLVLELDDNLWSLRPDNPAATAYKKGGDAIRNFTAICNEVDLITTTNNYLKNVIMRHTQKRHDQIVVLPNYIDLTLYTHRAKFKDNPDIQLTHFGSTTHFIDLSTEEFSKGIDRIMSEFPNVKLKFVGAFLPKYKMRWGRRYENAFGHMDIYEWIKTRFPLFMDETDILICPLDDDVYNRCKSNIKFLEASSAKIPGVYQRIRQYEEIVADGENGYLASTSQEWYDALKKLITNAAHRKLVGMAAFETIQDHTIQGNIHKYAQMFKSLLTAN